MDYVVCDTETTGMDPAEDRMVEIAAVHSDGRMLHTLVSPGDRRISFGAMAAHHITPAQLEGAPDALEALAIVGLAPQDAPEYLVFHNAAYDRDFLPEWLREKRIICTYRCALSLVPNAESHSNGALWYELGLSHPMPPEAGHMPHRALFDAIMTSDILGWLMSKIAVTLDDNSPWAPSDILAELHRITVSPILLRKCRLPKHKDELWEDVPSSYMQWILKQDFDADTKYTCEYWLDRRGRR